MADYDIAQRTGFCSNSKREFAEGELFFAVLFETDSGFERREYAENAWTGPPEGYFCFWKSQVPERREKQRLFVDNDVILNLFVRLEGNPEPIKLHFRFVLALILMRKRVLKYDQTLLDGGAEHWLMKQAKEQTIHRVLNPRLNDSEIERVSEELGAILHGDVRAFERLEAEPSDSDETRPGDV